MPASLVSLGESLHPKNLSSWIRNLVDTYGFHVITLITVGIHLLKGFVGGGGGSGLVGAGLEYHLRNHQVAGTSLQIYQSVAALPWSLKALMGLASDRYPLYKSYNKAPYVGIASVLATVAYFLNGFFFFSVQWAMGGSLCGRFHHRFSHLLSVLWITSQRCQ